MKVSAPLKWSIVGGIALLIGTLAYIHENVPLGAAMVTLLVACFLTAIVKGQHTSE